MTGFLTLVGTDFPENQMKYAFPWKSTCEWTHDFAHDLRKFMGSYEAPGSSRSPDPTALELGGYLPWSWPVLGDYPQLWWGWVSRSSGS